MKSKLTVEIPDANYWKKQVSCQDACPVHTDSRGYVRAIAEGDFEKAYLIARAPNPFASICGRICGAPCEAACRRKDLDEAVSIRALKRFVNEKFGPYPKKSNLSSIDFIKKFFAQKQDVCEDIDDIKTLLSRFKTTTIPEDAPSVGIIGSGCAGLSAAHDLCLMGIKPVIYEMESKPAGMLYYGVPKYRLPGALIDAEIDVIRAMGTEIICNTQVGKDITFSEIRSRHDAVLIAVGAKKSRKIPLPNSDNPAVIGGVDFLHDMAADLPVDLGEKIVVIGGGDVAYDVARTSLRHTEEDVSRTALRVGSVKEVSLVCLESFEEMPASVLEIEEAEEEGVTRYNSWGPKEVLLKKDGSVKGIRFVRCTSVFDEHKRFAPQFDDKEEMTLEADNILLAVGQAPDLSFIDAEDIKLNDRGLLEVGDDSIHTSASDVFVAGDIAYGPRLLIDAVASGKKAARSIYEFLTNNTIAFDLKTSHNEIHDHNREPGYENIERNLPETSDPHERRGSMDKIVEKNYTQIEAVKQGSRCFDCRVNTIFNGNRCILCGGCSNVCPEGCLKLVSAERLESDDNLQELYRNYHKTSAPISEGGAIIKDETICIRCGLCAQYCPVEAVTMDAFSFKENLNE